MRNITITLPLAIPAILTFNQSRKADPRAVRQAKNKLQKTTREYALQVLQRYEIDNGRPWEPLEDAIIWYTFVIHDRRSIRDDDNQLGGCKWIRDVLQKEMRGGRSGMRPGVGIYLDDRYVFNGHITWRIRKNESPATIVLIRELTKTQRVEIRRHIGIRKASADAE